MTELKPRVGQTYITLDGHEVTIIGVNKKKPAYPFIGRIYTHINKTHYNEKGESINYFRGWDIRQTAISAWNKRS